MTTNYVLDLAGGLTQVLADGTNAYLYGVGRIGEQQPAGWQYHLGDALGSVRQMTDAAGEITLARAYEPFGEVMNTAGSGASSYGFTGEWTDSSGLIHLRARYYASWDGRFLTRDTWEEDYYWPASYNAWVYGYSDPINMLDPTGTIPSINGINTGDYVYSCNCGWIDFTHASPGIAKSILNLLAQEKNQFSKLTEKERRDVYAISPSSEIIIIGNVSITAVVKRNLNQEMKKSVALAIYRSLQEEIEKKEWPSWSYYSLEDLTSDEIGFYLALTYGGKVDPTKDDGKNGEAWQYLARVCGFPNDRGEAKKWSRLVYESYDMNIIEWYVTKTPRVFTWGSPLLCSNNVVDTECHDKVKKWPSDFQSVIPSLEKRDGIWWKYNQSQDGELISTNYSGFHFLKH